MSDSKTVRNDATRFVRNGSLRKHLPLASLLLYCGVLVACGGGTAGTSGTSDGEPRERLITGSIVQEGGAPLVGAAVSVNSDSGEVLTDQLGNFELSAITGTEFILLIQTGERKITVEVDQVAADATLVTIDAKVDASDQASEVQSTKAAVDILAACKSIASVRGNTVNFNLATLPVNCELKLTFKGAGLEEGSADISLRASSCSSLSSETSSSRLENGQLMVIERLMIGKLTKDCRAELSARVSGSRTAPSFPLIFDLSTTAEPIPETPKSHVWVGSLALVEASPATVSCGLFERDFFQVRYNVDEKNTRFLGLRPRVGVSEATGKTGSELDRHTISKKLPRRKGVKSESVIVRPLTDPHRKRVVLSFEYAIALTDGESCSRRYQGEVLRVGG